MNLSPEVSIVIPTFNYGAFLHDCLQSVWSQVYQDYEVFLMDDGSTDNTPQIVKEWQPNFREKLNYIRSEFNQGVYRARNNAIRAARGRYIAFLDADDIWEPEALSELVAYLEAHPDLVMAYANTRFFYSGTKKDLGRNFGPGSIKSPHTGRCADKLFVEGNFIPFMTTLLRRRVFEQTGFFDETLKVGGDYDLFLRITSLYSIGYVDKVLCRVRRHERNLSFRSLLQAVTQVRILKKALKFFSVNQFQIDDADARRRWAQIYYELGAALVLDAKPKRARLALRKSLSLNTSLFSNKILIYLCLSFLPFAGYLKRLRTYWHVLREKIRIRSR